MKEMSNLKHTEKSMFPEKFPPLWAISKYFEFYTKNLKPLIANVCTQPLNGDHGLNTHTNAVVFRGIDYAVNMGENPLPVVFACAFHDIARTHDGWDTEHAKNAVPMAMKIMKNFSNLFDNKTRIDILSAIANHTTGGAAPDYISACLWDADRTRLAWNRGFNETFFNTLRGKYVAQHCKSYLEFQHEVFPLLTWSKNY